MIWMFTIGGAKLIFCAIYRRLVLATHVYPNIMWRIDQLLGNGSINTFSRKQTLDKQPVGR
jgi:hypothetical protein